ncbi:hypothetical protein LG293_01795 [Citricoccus nitrophenolicus]
MHGLDAVVLKSTTAVARDRSGMLALIGALTWIGIGAAVTFLDTNSALQTLVLSWMTILFSAWVFLRHGGPYITAAGVWSICSGLFVGFAGVYWQSMNPHDPAMVRAVGLAFLAHAFMYYGFWRGRQFHVPQTTGETNPDALRGLFPVGFLLLAAGTGLSILGIAEVIAGPAAFTGIILLVIAVVTGGRRRMKVIPLLFTGTLALVYTRFVFSGFGRIVLAALAFSIVMVLAMKYRTYWLKFGTLIVLPPALVVLIEQREQFGLVQYGASLDGLGSIVEPLRQFSVMLAQPVYEYAFGSTFWAAAVTHVPSALWEGKPDGFGLEIGWIYNPSLASIGGTLAALSHGEWIYNFGPLGLILMAVLIGLAIRFLDVSFLKRVASGINVRRDALVLTALVIAGGGMTDLFWGGTHTFMGRAGTRLLILLILFALWGWLRSAQPRKTQSAPPAAGSRTRHAHGVVGANRRDSQLDRT